MKSLLREAGVMEETLLSVGIDTGAASPHDRPACLGAPM